MAKALEIASSYKRLSSCIQIDKKKKNYYYIEHKKQDMKHTLKSTSPSVTFSPLLEYILSLALRRIFPGRMKFKGKGDALAKPGRVRSM